VAESGVHSQKAGVFVAAVGVDDLHEGGVSVIDANFCCCPLESRSSRVHANDLTHRFAEFGFEVFGRVRAHVAAEGVANAREVGRTDAQLAQHLKKNVFLTNQKLRKYFKPMKIAITVQKNVDWSRSFYGNT